MGKQNKHTLKELLGISDKEATDLVTEGVLE